MYDYLSFEILNKMENAVLNLHTEFSSTFNIEESELIQISNNTNLSGKTLYLNFPWETYENIISVEKIDILTTNNGAISFYKNDTENVISCFKNDERYLYAKRVDEKNNYINYIRYKMPNDFGKITSISNSELLNYIKISSDENFPLTYSKKIWKINEPVYLQEIDRIEQGIQSIADCLYEPDGYENKTWTEVGSFQKDNLSGGLEQKPIRAEDINRMQNNIQLLLEIIKVESTIWNISSTIIWNETSNLEWSE